MNDFNITSQLLQSLVETAEKNHEGQTANYIPELAHVDPDICAISIQLMDGTQYTYQNKPTLEAVTLQSTAKLIPLIGLLEEYGPDQVFEWVKVEPSGDEFSSITRLEQFGPKPSNPMLNAGAITLCSHIPGSRELGFAWLESWVKTLFNKKLRINPTVFASEKSTGDRNRSLAYLLKSRQILQKNVDETLDLYFTLCSYEAELNEMLYLPTLLANGGKDPLSHTQIISSETCKITLSIMATCGLYDESGTHLVRTGMPAKSGVSGYIIACIPKIAGIVTLSPRVNPKGNSIRSQLMLEGLAKATGWHFSGL